MRGSGSYDVALVGPSRCYHMCWQSQLPPRLFTTPALLVNYTIQDFAHGCVLLFMSDFWMVTCTDRKLPRKGLLPLFETKAY